MSAVIRVREEDGTTLMMTCACGADLETFISKEVPYYDGQGDFECNECDRIYNSSGQELRFNTRAGFEANGGESYCGERWDED